MVARFGEQRWFSRTRVSKHADVPYHQAITGREGVALLPYEVRKLAKDIMGSLHWFTVSTAMKNETENFIEQHIVNALASLRSKLGMFPASHVRDDEIGREAILELDEGV